MKLAVISSSFLTVLALGCASTGSGAPTASAASDKASENKEMDRKMAVASDRLDLAKMEVKVFEQQLDVQIRHAMAEVGLAEAKLAKFRDLDAPNRLASEKLSLRTAKDRAQEAVDELAQIEIMYEDQDLDDLTAEFVVSRGRRAAERAQQRIEIMEGQYKALMERELPQEEDRLELALDKAKAALDKAKMEGEINRGKKSLAVREAQNAIEKLKEEMDKEAKP